LGLQVSEEITPVPTLSPLHLSSADPSNVVGIVRAWRTAGIVCRSEEDGKEYIRAENDTFVLEAPRDEDEDEDGDGGWSVAALAAALPQAVQTVLPSGIAASSSPLPTAQAEENTKPQANAQTPLTNSHPTSNSSEPKTLIPHTTSQSSRTQTPDFIHPAFYTHLTTYQTLHHREAPSTWGRTLLYATVLSSTSTLLEKNPAFLAQLPSGTTAVAKTQIAGRGRGNNVWVSPPGSLLFSTVVRHGAEVGGRAPVVLVQYLAALAIVAGIKGYERGWEGVEVRIKWPNDVYILDPSSVGPGAAKSRNGNGTARNDYTTAHNSTNGEKRKDEGTYTKLSGILVNSSYQSGAYTLVVGIGLNLLNPQPTLSLAQIAAYHNLAPPTQEKLLASILTHFEELYTRFCRTGFDKQFEGLYYKAWLHSGQIVVLEDEGGVRVRVRGITRDFGLLVCEEVGTGKRWEVMSDSNSFDFFKGLVRRKT